MTSFNDVKVGDRVTLTRKDDPTETHTFTAVNQSDDWLGGKYNSFLAEFFTVTEHTPKTPVEPDGATAIIRFKYTSPYNGEEYDTHDVAAANGAGYWHKLASTNSGLKWPDFVKAHRITSYEVIGTRD